MLDRFLSDDSTAGRFRRTVAQGLVSVLVVALPVIAAGLDVDPRVSSLLTAAAMCVLSPLMAALRTGDPEDGLYDATERGGIE